MWAKAQLQEGKRKRENKQDLKKEEEVKRNTKESD